MVNRRHIRIKVMQSIYALLQSNNDDLTKEEKFLNLSVQKTFDLYILQLILLVEVKNMEDKHLEIKKNKFLATSEDKKPSLKLVNNRIINAIEQSSGINNYIKDKNLEGWNNDREYVRLILDKIKENKEYKEYINSSKDSFEEDKDFILDIFKEIVAPNDKLFDYYESMNLSWVDDLPFVNTFITKTIKNLKSNQFINISNLVIKQDDHEFLLDLFRKSVLHNSDYDADIDSKTPNWDNERIAEIDMILIKMALTEFLYFPSIPTKVTINEYIEIAKDYSTQKSGFFINGVLDKILKVYQQDKRLHKIGRGLL